VNEGPLVAAARAPLWQAHEAFAFEAFRANAAMTRRVVRVGHAGLAGRRAGLVAIDALVELAVAQAPGAARLMVSREALDASSGGFVTEGLVGDALAVRFVGATDTHTVLTHGGGGGAVGARDALGARVALRVAVAGLAVFVVDALDAGLRVTMGSVSPTGAVAGEDRDGTAAAHAGLAAHPSLAADVRLGAGEGLVAASEAIRTARREDGDADHENAESAE